MKTPLKYELTVHECLNGHDEYRIAVERGRGTLEHELFTIIPDGQVPCCSRFRTAAVWPVEALEKLTDAVEQWRQQDRDRGLPLDN